jgi:predicted alpha/beta-fold hydrolase
MIAKLNKTDTPKRAPGAEVPNFEPHPWLRGRHAQTIVARFWGGVRDTLPETAHEVELPDGDRLVLLESVPQRPSIAPVALLVHGLAGDAAAPYMLRLGIRLFQRGVRVIRLNLRGAGTGFGLARNIYHAGRSDDIRHVVEWLTPQLGGAPIALLGFSLGANLVLKLAAESADRPMPGVACVLAANPPIDLKVCALEMQKPVNRFYDLNFARWLRAMTRKLHTRFPELGEPDLDGVWTVYDFDDRYTAPRSGFESADDYYSRCSLVSSLERIPIPGLIVHAMDDPVIPHEPFLRAIRPPHLALELVKHGGHLGYLSRDRWQGDHRWLDSRLERWLLDHWGIDPLAEQPR